MMETLKRLISPEYLVVAEPGPMGGMWVLYLALGLLFGVGLGMAAWLLFGARRDTRTQVQRAWAWFELWVCLAGLGTVVARFLNWPGWSARIWPYSLASMALSGVLIYRFRHVRLPLWLAAQLRILALIPAPRPCAPILQRSTHFPYRYIAGLLFHLAGIAMVLGAYHAPAWLAPLVLLSLLVPQAPLVARRRLPHLMALAPLLGAYAGVLLWLMYSGLDITIIGWQGLAFPNPMVSLFYRDGIILSMGVYAILCQLRVMTTELEKPTLFWRTAAIGLLAATLAWSGIVYFGKRTHGATASDPYAYAQMGVDLAQRGTFLHRFPLFEEVMPLDIAWAPLQPVGYHIPRNEQGDCPSVWATGASVLFAGGYLLLGEVGLYVTNPIVGLLALAATWALIQEVLRREPRPVRYLAGALAMALLATSPEHVDRLLVPMADASALLFTVLTLLFALRGMRQLASGRQAYGSFFLAGIFLAWAYWVRHTQLVLALPVALAIILGTREPSSNRKRLVATVQHMGLFFVAALLAALPDIVYRWRVFGGPLATETTELHLMHLRHIFTVGWQMLRDSLVAGEWGYLFPLVIYGAYRLARDHRREAIVLGSALVAVLLVHLTYRSLRLRDLISLFALVDLAVAYGAVALVRQVQALAPRKGQKAELGAAVLPGLALTWIILSLGLSRWTMIDNLWRPGWASFGYMQVEHRRAFDQLASLTPPDAVIGASLNAGAVVMYSSRDAIRPYDSWTEDEWRTFARAMHAVQRPIYLLDDGKLMADFIEAQEIRHRLTPIEELQVPIFYTGDRQTGWLYRLEWEE
jgi:hypothetical protein